MKIQPFVFFITVFASVVLSANEVKAPKPKAEEVFRTNTMIWSIALLDAETALLAEKTGRILRVDLKTKQSVAIEGVPSVEVFGQGGRMDLQLHPRFKQNQLIYFTYAVKNKENSYSTRLSRARLDKNKLSDLKVLFTADVDSAEAVHFGSRIVFDQKGFVYFGVGDRGQRHAAQDLKSHQGKIFRLHDDGRIPQDNPFVKTKDARPEIWSLGHRNPQGMSLHPETGAVYSNEHGPRGGDEINLVLSGKNYGWPVITFGREYYGLRIGEGTKKDGLEQPIHQFTPSIAPSSLLIYSGKIFKDWKHHFFSGALALQHLNRLAFLPNQKIEEERLFQDLNERIRDVEESPDGLIYFATDSGKLFRVSTGI